MSSIVTSIRRRLNARSVLIVLAAVAVLAALLTPEVTEQKGNYSSYSVGPNGTRVAFELAQRMGWRVTRREAPLDSAAPTVQVVIAPSYLGRSEVHALLQNVRRGGGLLFSMGANGELADSIGIGPRRHGDLLMDFHRECVRDGGRLGLSALPPSVLALSWFRPAPAQPVQLASVRDVRGMSPVAVGVPFGAGRIAIVGGDEPFANESVRACQWDADVLVASALQYLRGDGSRPLVFDEFHHGYGRHEGSVSAIADYLSKTASGHLFATLLLAGVLLLFASSPRPVIPKEAARIARRSPLEHADALGRAYADVSATRTATSRLVSGLRRRAGRLIPTARTAEDSVFLETIARRYPSLKSQVELLQRGLREQTSPRDFAKTADAIEEIERVVWSSSSVTA